MANRHNAFKWNALAVAATIAIVVAFMLAAQSMRNHALDANRNRVIQARADLVACQRINKLNKLIQDQLRVSLKGLSGITYYRQHPDELAKQKQRTVEEIQAFAPEKCEV